MLIRRFVIQESADRLVGKLLATLTRHLTHAFPGTQDGAGCQEKNQGSRSGVKFFLDISFHRTLSHKERVNNKWGPPGFLHLQGLGEINSFREESMKPRFVIFFLILMNIFHSACSRTSREETPARVSEQKKYKLERVGPADVVQLYAEGFE